MRHGDQGAGPSLTLFAALQSVWIGAATLGLWAGVRTGFGVSIDEQVWMFGIALPLTLVSMSLSRMTHWRQAPTLVAVSTALHVGIYLLPLYLLMGAPANIIAAREVAGLVAFFAALYTGAIVTGLIVFRLLKKEPAI